MWNRDRFVKKVMKQTNKFVVCHIIISTAEFLLRKYFQLKIWTVLSTMFGVQYSVMTVLKNDMCFTKVLKNKLLNNKLVFLYYLY